MVLGEGCKVMCEIDLNIHDERNVIAEYYKSANYYIIDRGNKSGKYLIFFSGNGLYFPNTVECFNEKIVQRNRYEWENVIKGAKQIEQFEKIIFVRDLYKTWYVKGINDEVNSIDKLAHMLINLCKDASDVVTVGNSAGGYIATLMGLKLGASAVYNFSGQYDITEYVRDNPFWKKYISLEGKIYLKLAPMIRKSDMSVFYFFPAHCEADLQQYELVKDLKNVYPFAMDEVSHGTTVLPINYQYIFTMNKAKLKKISKRNRGRLINKKIYLVTTAGLWHAIVEYINFRIGNSNYNNNAHL